MIVFSKNLKAWRIFKGLTQAVLAARSGISRPNLVTLEQGRRDCTLTTLNRLAFVLGLSPGTILDDQPPVRRRHELGRHEVDRVARSLITGQKALPEGLLEIRRQVALQAAPLLQAVGIKIKGRLRKRPASQDKKVVGRVLERLERFLPNYLPEGGL